MFRSYKILSCPWICETKNQVIVACFTKETKEMTPVNITIEGGVKLFVCKVSLIGAKEDYRTGYLFFDEDKIFYYGDIPPKLYYNLLYKGGIHIVKKTIDSINNWNKGQTLLKYNTSSVNI